MTAPSDIAWCRDPIDAAFLCRATAAAVADAPAPPHVDDRIDGSGRFEPRPARVPPPPIVATLLQAVPDQWRCVADQIEEAHGRGRRVIAIAGGGRGEGRTTIVDGLEETLAARGRAVTRVTRSHVLEAVGRRPETITLVDAGIWFPPGPIRLARLAAAAQGCDAAILVRRADESPCPARADALTRIGIECLGELETFATS